MVFNPEPPLNPKLTSKWKPSSNTIAPEITESDGVVEGVAITGGVDTVMLVLLAVPRGAT